LRTIESNRQQSPRFPRSKIRFLRSPVVLVSKIFHAFSPMNPAFSLFLKRKSKNYFDSFRSVAHSHAVNKKDGFTGSLQIGDTLFPECVDLGLGLTVTAENIAELTAIFMNESLLTAVADSVATALPVDVAISFESVDAAISLLRSRFMDVDWDTFPNRVTIFGDDQRIEGDEYAGLWVLNLIFAPAPARFGDVNAI